MLEWTNGVIAQRASLAFWLAGAVFAGTSCNDDVVQPATPSRLEAGSPLGVTTSTALAFAQMSAGDLHSCGLTTEHRAYCWGVNTFGQVGEGRTRRTGWCRSRSWAG